MSISYWICFNWSAGIEQVAGALLSDSDLGSEIDAERTSASKVSLKSPQFNWFVTKSSMSWREMLKEDLGVEICTDIVVLVGDGFSTDGEGGRMLTRVVGLLLQMTEDDFVFMFNGEKVLLLRDSSGVFIDNGAGFWNISNRELLSKFVSVVPRSLPSI